MGASKIGITVVILVCILFPFYSNADKLDEQYIGCYQDNGTVPDLEDGIHLESMTISLCINHCKSKNKTYAGAQNGQKCFCGDTYGTYGLSHECKVNCPGDASYYCGGNLLNSIYSVCPSGRYGNSCDKECHCSKDRPCILSNGSCLNGTCASGWKGKLCNGTAVSASQLAHFGCFTDARTNGFPLLFQDSKMTIQLCMDRCRTDFGLGPYLYAGLQFSEYCFCGNSSYSANGTKPTTDCSSTCAGSSADHCGGAWANDVYSNCQDGYYGTLCSYRCHCLQGSNCTIEDGTCPPGGCSEGWTGKSCNIRNCTDNNGNCTGENEMCVYEKTGEGADQVVPRCRCKEGYTRNQEYEECRDINECTLTSPSNLCDPKFGECFNLVGSYNCTCKTGFQNNGIEVCEDIDECTTIESNQCNSTFGECINLDGTYECTCKTGFQNNGSKVCEDIDECSPAHSDIECKNNTGNCNNTLGSYTCSCFEGFFNADSDKYCTAIHSDSSSTGAIVGAVVGSLCAILIILALLAFLYWRRRQSKKASAGRRNSGFSNAYKEDNGSSIEVDQLWQIQTTKMREEFKSVQMESDYPTDYASSPELKQKNKYRNILPYNQNRVKLNVIDDDPFSDYINASFISTYRNIKVIASHGPQSATVNDFWRMVWEQDVAVIVMITKCIENGRQKCAAYWPEKRETKVFGLLEITNVEEESFADYTIRRITVGNGTESRVVFQCHFMAWPDHDVPSHAYTLLKFRRTVLKNMSENKGVVIHCSAGVGRTGTFIAIDNLLCEAEDTSRVDVLKCLMNLRQQRMHMIQTEEQYIFVYLAIVEAHMAGETALSCSEFARKFSSKTNMKAAIEREYQALGKRKLYLTDDDKYDSLLPCNLAKNRDVSIVPASRYRVFILTREKDRSDYITAVFCQSFNFKEAYIQTQLPLPDTVVDFWNMCSDYNCQFVVVLDENKYPDFIPTPKEPLAFQHLTVCYKGQKPIPGGILFDLLLMAKRKSQKSAQEVEESIYMNTEIGNTVTVAIISSTKNGLFHNTDMLSLYNVMRAKHSPEQQSKIPVVVVCRNGCTHSSVFICMANLLDMIESQKEVDVFETVHDIRMTRPQAIESLMLYEQLYAITLQKLQVSREEAVDNGRDEDGAIYVNS